MKCSPVIGEETCVKIVRELSADWGCKQSSSWDAITSTCKKKRSRECTKTDGGTPRLDFAMWRDHIARSPRWIIHYFITRAANVTLHYMPFSTLNLILHPVNLWTEHIKWNLETMKYGGWDHGEMAAFNLASQWPVGGIDWNSESCWLRNCVPSMHVGNPWKDQLMNICFYWY